MSKRYHYTVIQYETVSAWLSTRIIQQLSNCTAQSKKSQIHQTHKNSKTQGWKNRDLTKIKNQIFLIQIRFLYLNQIIFI